MKMEIGRYRITIYPENDLDVAYIEEVLGLKEDGDKIELVRKNIIGVSHIAYLETEVEWNENWSSR